MVGVFVSGKFSQIRRLGLHHLNTAPTRLSMTSPSASPYLSSSTLPAEKQVDRMLTGKEDDHGGVIVEMTKEPLDPSLFVSLLRASISQWRQLVLLIALLYAILDCFLPRRSCCIHQILRFPDFSRLIKVAIFFLFFFCQNGIEKTSIWMLIWISKPKLVTFM